MKAFRSIRGAAVVLATFGMAVPCPATFAGDSATKMTVKTAKSQVSDISMSAGGTFQGRVIDRNGNMMEGAQVTIKQDGKNVSEVVTDKQGAFAFNNLKTGVYQVSSGNADGTFRLWSDNAPPAAKEFGLLVQGKAGERGQSGVFDDDNRGALLVGGGAAAVATGIALGVGRSNLRQYNLSTSN